jgi:hypothetical protein
LFGHDIAFGKEKGEACDAPPDAVIIYSGSALFRWLDMRFYYRSGNWLSQHLVVRHFFADNTKLLSEAIMSWIADQHL